MTLWGRNDVRTHITQALVWAHDTVRPGKWHVLVGRSRATRNGGLGEREVATACGRRVVDSYGYERLPGEYRWRGKGVPPVGRFKTEGICRRCARTQ